MRLLILSVTAGLAIFAAACMAQPQAADGPYHVLKTAKVGGEGGFDYVYADSDGRRLYVARTGPMARVSVYNLDTLEPAGELANTSARGRAVDGKSQQGFAASKPVPMWGS